MLSPRGNPGGGGIPPPCFGEKRPLFFFQKKKKKKVLAPKVFFLPPAGGKKRGVLKRGGAQGNKLFKGPSFPPPRGDSPPSKKGGPPLKPGGLGGLRPFGGAAPNFWAQTGFGQGSGTPGTAFKARGSPPTRKGEGRPANHNPAPKGGFGSKGPKSTPTRTDFNGAMTRTLP